MKKVILLLTLGTLLLSCDVNDTKGNTSLEENWKNIGSLSEVRQITVDSCEYIVVSGVESVAIVHKANCKNHDNNNDGVKR